MAVCALFLLLSAAITRADDLKPAVLCISNPQSVEESGLPAKLRRDYGFQIAATNFDTVDWTMLQKFNVVILFDMSRLNADVRTDNHVDISTAGFERLSQLLMRFVRQGGGLYVYGTSFTNMGGYWGHDTLDKFLAPYDAQVLFEELSDPALEKRQAAGRQVLYARAAKIAQHPATAGVSAWWYPSGPFSYGPWTKPLQLSHDWTSLISTSGKFVAKPVDPQKGWNNYLATPSQVKSAQAVIYAARQFEKGRIVLNGSESTISFFGYGYSPYADEQWGRIGMEKGLDGVLSDGLKLLASSLRWLSEPSLQSGVLGGYIRPEPKPLVARVPSPISWGAPGQVGSYRYQRGVFGAMPKLGGGSGSVAEWKTAAIAAGLQYIVLCGDFGKMDESQWKQLAAQCTENSDADIALIPALLTEDEYRNKFVQAGPKSWPQRLRRAVSNDRYVRDHLGYWMNDCNFPLRAPYWFSSGSYPAWLHSGYDSFAVRTYQDGKLVDDALPGFLHNQMQGDRSRILVMNLMTAPDKLPLVKELTYIHAGKPADVAQSFIGGQFHGGGISYVSSGPRIEYWGMVNGWRQTFGELYVPGTERWRAHLKLTSDTPLKSVTIYDGQNLFRRYALSGLSAQVDVEGLHDNRRTLVAVVEDAAGKTATSGAIEEQDSLFAQIFCSDRCNIMGGVSVVRDADGRETGAPATSMLYKAGRLNFSPIAKAEGLPGIDGSGGGTQFALYFTSFLTAESGGEERASVHQINRPYENADAIVFDTPILKRSSAPDSDIFGHNPYVPLDEPKVDARLIQYHFYRKPILPSPVLAEFSVTPRSDVKLKKGWQGFTVRYGAAWGSPNDFKGTAILRAGSSALEAVDKRWEGTLQPGDAIAFPEIGEAMFVLENPLACVIELDVARKWFRLYVGRFETDSVKAGQTIFNRVLQWKLGERGDAVLQALIKLRSEYGLTGDKPEHTITPTQGKVVSTRYLLDAQAIGNSFETTISKASLPQRLPIRVTGLSDKWTAAKVDLTRKQWFPLGVWNGATLTTLDASEGDHDLFIGNIATCDNSDVFLTLIRNGETTSFEVHNPTNHDITVTVKVGTSTFLANAGKQTISVPKMNSFRFEWKP
jgi:hypothetical protein